MQRRCSLGNVLFVEIPYENRNTWCILRAVRIMASEKKLWKIPSFILFRSFSASFQKFLIRKFHVLLIIYVRNIYIVRTSHIL